VAPVTVGVLRLNVVPVQTGPLLLAVGVEGMALTVRVTGLAKACPQESQTSTS
jgi:hypothetical protein